MSATKLKNTRFSIREQFPREVVERRKVLYPVMKRALQEKKRVSMVVDKLYIDGRLYQEELDEGKPEGATGPRVVEVNSDSEDGAGNRVEITRGVR